MSFDGVVKRGVLVFWFLGVFGIVLIVTDCRLEIGLVGMFQFGFDLREYSGMYLISGGGDIFLVRKLFYF